MKKIMYVLFVLVAFSTISWGQVKTDEKKMVINKTTGDTTYTESVIISESEDITVRNNMIAINVLKFYMFYNIAYYRKVSEFVVVGAEINGPTFTDNYGIGFNAEVRFHTKGKNMRGFYIAPNFSYKLAKSYSNDTYNEVNSNVYSIGILLGWQWFPGEQFAMGLGLGADFYYNADKNTHTFIRDNGFLPLLRFDVGYAW